MIANEAESFISSESKSCNNLISNKSKENADDVYLDTLKDLKQQSKESNESKEYKENSCKESKEYNTNEKKKKTKKKINDNDNSYSMNSKNKEKTSNKKCRWSKEEEDLLMNLTRKKPNNWDLITSKFPDKTIKQCYTKHSKLITNFKKGKWTEQEDDLIIKLTNDFDFDWKSIASKYPKRSLTQIKQRYYNSLDQSINKTQFTDEEDLLLLEKYKIYGANWKIIATFFKNRPSNLIKNRFYTKTRNSQKGIFFTFKCLFLFVLFNLFCLCSFSFILHLIIKIVLNVSFMLNIYIFNLN